jgi:hypothetical protein
MLVPVGAMWHRPGADRDDVALTRLWCERHRRLWVTDGAAGAVMIHAIPACGPLAVVRERRPAGAGDEPMVREAGARHRLAHVTLTRIVWYPVAPSGSVRCFSEVWV